MGKSKGKMRSKTKFGVRKPPLSMVDKILYLVSFPVVIAIGFGMLKLHDCLHVLLSDPSVVARTGDGFLFVYIIALVWWFGAVWFLGRQFSAKQPIFGNPQVTYGVFPWKKDLFPLFGDYPEKKKLKKDTYTSRKKRKERLMTAGLCVVCYLMLMVWFGVTGWCLRDDYSITAFQLSGWSVKRVYTPKDFDELEISAHRHSQRRGPDYWDISVLITMNDGEAYRVCNTDFERRNPNRHNDALEMMTEIKALFPSEAVSVESDGKEDYLIERYDYDAHYARILRELFDLE